MKARKLRTILNNTKYTISNREEYIAVGSPMCHDLISVNKKTLKLKYALDPFNGGRTALAKESQKELLFIWDKLQELIDSGEIKDIIEGVDVIENPITVWTFNDGKIVETYTDAFGYPNTTFDGEMMYENTHFKTRKEAIEKALDEYGAGVNIATRQVKEKEAELKKAKDWLAEEQGYMMQIIALKN